MARSSRRRAHARLSVDALEPRDVPSSSLGLTPLVEASGASPLAPPASGSTAIYGSELEPQLAVDPTNPDLAVAVWQQDRFRTAGGARALGFSVTTNASSASGATWTAPAVIPGFDGSAAGSPFQRYTDPWVSIAPNGTIYVSALAVTPTGPFPAHTAIQVVTSTDHGVTWTAPRTLYEYDAPPGTDPIDQTADKEAVTADPRDPTGKTAYVVWDNLNHPSDQQNFNAFHGYAFRGDTLFSKTTDGGLTWTTKAIFTPLANQQSLGNQIVVLPDGTLVNGFTLFQGSGNQPAKAGRTHLAVMRSTDGGDTWTEPIVGPALQAVPVSDPDTGAAVRVGEPIGDIAVDPNSGNLYQVWCDSRFSNFDYNGIAFSMSTDGGLTWSEPIKVNRTPANTGANQQAFTPSVAVAADGTVAVTYYDFRNNTSAAGVPTDYWLVHASGNFTNPASWATDEKRLTDSSFDIEKAPNTSRGYFLGDYEGLSAAGNNFYALFAQAGSGATDPHGPSSLWFRDPPPAPEATPVAGVSVGGGGPSIAWADGGAGAGLLAPSETYTLRGGEVRAVSAPGMGEPAAAAPPAAPAVTLPGGQLLTWSTGEAKDELWPAAQDQFGDPLGVWVG